MCFRSCFVLKMPSASCLYTTDDQVLCSGYCNGVFHLSCAGLSREAMEKVGGNPQLGWFCAECIEFRKVASELSNGVVDLVTLP